MNVVNVVPLRALPSGKDEAAHVSVLRDETVSLLEPHARQASSAKTASASSG